MTELPVSFALTSAFGSVYRYNTPDCPVRLRELPTGLGGAPFKFDDDAGVNQPGVTTRGRIDDPNVIGTKVRVDGPKGMRGRDILRQWRRDQGRGFAELPDGPLMRFECEDTGRFQMVRLLDFKNEPDYVKMHALGRADDEIAYRSDESWWRTDPVVRMFKPSEFAAATVPTYGQEMSWAHYKITGPLVAGKLGIGGEQITIPNISSGETLEIETDPNWFAIESTSAANPDPVDRSSIGNRWYKQVPADITGEGTDVPIAISGVGASNSTTRLTVTFPQLFRTAL